MKSIAWGAKSAQSKLERMEIDRDDPRDHEVLIRVLYTGVCHSDIHQVKNEWANTVYPCVPGHEIVGEVQAAGAKVSRFRTGDRVGVGCMIDSCRRCDPCRAGDQNYCEGPNSWLATYNGPMTPASETEDNSNQYGRDNTFGGYSDLIVVPENFVLRLPDALDARSAAPILCAGVTTYAPMKHWKVGQGSTIGVLGIGGLGHMAVQIAKALGAEVTALTSTPDKLDAARALGANRAVIATDKAALSEIEGSLDLIIDTVPEKHEVGLLLPLLKRDRALVVVGNLDVIDGINNMDLAMKRQIVSGSVIGNLEETQEVLDLCAAKGVAPETEMISIDEINDAFVKVENGEVRFRYIIDMQSLN